MKYIGNKTRLLNFIYDSMKKSNIPFNGVFIDVFGGTGSVGRYFKSKGFKIISNDLMTYSYIQQYVTVTLNKMPSFNKLCSGGVKNAIKYLNNLKGKKGYVFNNYCPSGSFKRQYFSNENGKKIDAIRDKIEEWYKTKKLSYDEYMVLVCSLINAADFVANISGTYGAYLKIWRSMALKKLTLLEPNIFTNNKNNEAYQKDANILVRKNWCDVLYIDPPYNERQYAPNFHVLESISVWDKQKLKGKTGQRDYSKTKSLYCLRSKAVSIFEDLIRNAHAKYIIVSYNNEGIIPRKDILHILKAKGILTEYTTDYRRFRTESDNDHRQYKKCNDKVVEHLFIVKSYKI